MIKDSDWDPLTRRDFAKRLGQIGIGAGVLGLAGCGSQYHGKTAKQRKSGRTDLVLSPLGFGAQHTRDADLIRAALDHGVNLIETAFAYGFGKAGNSCQCIGKAIAGKRDSVCLAVAYQVLIATTEQFADHAAVADGASDLFVQIFGRETGHVRLVYGVQSLPIGAPVIVDSVFEIEVPPYSISKPQH